ncbi:hypothetical protein D6C91_02690 [Aureobasidium pullulans]|uniref:WAC domain-containing protein n=1 Tax=Aureobasidium pullulans TaxID=5580 RepID=A0A4S9TME0_AURPU|nr:hypothetical protein D6C91_02690 [Aureobasidium pullulans]
MVLYKRKPVTMIPVPAKVENNTEVWVMPKSGEVFTDYESYLSRFEFYNRKKFTDAVNGKSGLTYFAAIDSENNSCSDIDKIFPDALRDPILRKVQFSDISRIDELVSFVFDEFRNDFFPGEEVHVSLDNGDQYEGVIREKAKFPQLLNPDGSIQRAAFSRYFVKLNNELGDEALLDDKHIKRNRKLFTKQNLRSFLKSSIQRDMFTGAPWLVKEHLARQYRLPMEIPAHLAQRMQASPQPGMPRQPQGTSIFNKVNGRKGKNLTIGDFELDGSPQGYTTPPLNGSKFPGYQTTVKTEPQKTAPVPIKYPIEDLDVPARKTELVRPDLKFIAPQTPSEGDIRMEYVGPLLEIWNTLNVHSEVLTLDAFTFDDFLEAMKFASDEVRCELLEEAHCAVLKTIVNAEGTLQVTLPDMIEDESSDEEMDESEPATPILDAPAHATRSRMSNISNVEPDESNGRSSRTPAEGRHRPHRTPELLASYGWVERLQARDFVNGGWQTIMAGLLHQLSLNPRQKSECDKVLSRLVPLDEDPNQESVRVNYNRLDINLRISALQLVTLLCVSTKTVRGYLEDMSEEQTRIRKDKLEHQKAKKESVAKLSDLETQKKILLPDNLPDSPKEEHPDPMDISMSHVDDTMDTMDLATSDAEEEGGRSLRRGNERKRKRDEDAARREKQREEKKAKTNPKQSKEFTKLLKDIDKLKIEIAKREKEIATCDADLREANCQRTKVLGRDRFWNRYYWFERNGMPFTGLTDGSTGEYGYANGRIWVQGPDEMERLGFIDLPEDLQRTYVQDHGLSVPDRKAKEEGATSLRTANEWGYYDDPETIALLLSWFDDRGVREKALRKEMAAWQEPIIEQMRTLRTHLDSLNQEDADEEPVTRVSTRKKVYVDIEASSQRCLRWRNLAALDKNGHLHSEQPKPKEKKSKKEAKGVAKVVVKGKAATRQGTKYGK